jgi:hypothetical protein
VPNGSPVHERLFKEHKVIALRRESMYKPGQKEEQEIKEKCTF